MAYSAEASGSGAGASGSGAGASGAGAGASTGWRRSRRLERVQAQVQQLALVQQLAQEQQQASLPVQLELLASERPRWL